MQRTLKIESSSPQETFEVAVHENEDKREYENLLVWESLFVLVSSEMCYSIPNECRNRQLLTKILRMRFNSYAKLSKQKHLKLGLVTVKYNIQSTSKKSSANLNNEPKALDLSYSS